MAKDQPNVARAVVWSCRALVNDDHASVKDADLLRHAVLDTFARRGVHVHLCTTSWQSPTLAELALVGAPAPQPSPGYEGVHIDGGHVAAHVFENVHAPNAVEEWTDGRILAHNRDAILQRNAAFEGWRIAHQLEHGKDSTVQQQLVAQIMAGIAKHFPLKRRVRPAPLVWYDGRRAYRVGPHGYAEWKEGDMLAWERVSGNRDREWYAKELDFVQAMLAMFDQPTVEDLTEWHHA